MVSARTVSGWVQNKNRFKMQMDTYVKGVERGSGHIQVDVNNFFL